MSYRWQPTLDYFFEQINDGLDRIIFVEQNFVLTDEVSETLCVGAAVQRIKLNARAAKRELQKMAGEGQPTKTLISSRVGAKS